MQGPSVRAENEQRKMSSGIKDVTIDWKDTVPQPCIMSLTHGVDGTWAASKVLGSANARRSDTPRWGPR